MSEEKEIFMPPKITNLQIGMGILLQIYTDLASELIGMEVKMSPQTKQNHIIAYYINEFYGSYTSCKN